MVEDGNFCKRETTDSRSSWRAIDPPVWVHGCKFCEVLARHSYPSLADRSIDIVEMVRGFISLFLLRCVEMHTPLLPPPYILEGLSDCMP